MAYSGLRSRAQALEILTNNLANARSTAFKGEGTYFQVMERLERPQMDALEQAINGPSVEARGRTNFRQGTPEKTGNPLDLAISGDGFFVVMSERGVRYTRNGAFQLKEDGQLVNAFGHAVLSDQKGPGGEPRPVVVPPGEIHISPNGQVSVDGIASATLKVVSFGDPHKLLREGSSLFAAPDGVNEVPPARTEILQGYLEGSNVDPLTSVTGMIQLMRSFEMLTQTIRSLTREVDQRVINEVGKV